VQITITLPWRRITRHLSHMRFTEARTFIGVLSFLQTKTLPCGALATSVIEALVLWRLLLIQRFQCWARPAIGLDFGSTRLGVWFGRGKPEDDG